MGKNGRPGSDEPTGSSGFSRTGSGISQALFHETFLKERRKSERFFVEGVAYAALGPDFNLMGHIVNISLKGLAFYYIDVGGGLGLNRTTVQLRDSRQIICTLPFESISDTDGDVADPYSSVEIRYHRGRFVKLSREQTRDLRAFLEKRTALGHDR